MLLVQVANFRFFAEFVRDYKSEKFEMDDAINHDNSQTCVAGLITPWNLSPFLEKIARNCYG